MAREITTIYNEIIENKNDRSELSDLNSTSNVAIYRLWAYIMSVAIFTHEFLWDLFKADIEATLEARINGTNEWYSQKALEYQDGDDVSVINDGTEVGYTIVVPDNRIITRAAYSEDVDGSKGRLDLKLAKGEIGSLEKLSDQERIRVVEYFNKIKFAGTNINIISIQPDELTINDVTVYHDGTRSDQEIRTDVESAMNTFLEQLPFDGVVYKQLFIDAIQAVANVADIEVTDISVKEYSNELSPTETDLGRKKTLEAGYGIISYQVDSLTNLKISLDSELE